MTPRPDGLELVCLDLGDTLIRPQPSWVDVYLAVCADEGMPLSRRRLEAGFASALVGGTLDELGPFEASAAASFARVRRFDAAVMTGAGVSEIPHGFYQAVAARFAAPASWRIFPDVLPALRRLRAAGLRLAVVSNWVWEGPGLVTALGLGDWFEAIAISDRVGVSKPHPAIFRAALAAVGVTPDRAVHVGDSYPKDVLGATGVGMGALLLVRDGAVPVPALPDGRPVTVVRDLLDVADFVGA
ncbi:MAG: HAD family hydrolase [Candidatus Limnocylindrales bacterium]